MTFLCPTDLTATDQAKKLTELHPSPSQSLLKLGHVHLVVRLASHPYINNINKIVIHPRAVGVHIDIF